MTDQKTSSISGTETDVSSIQIKPRNKRKVEAISSCSISSNSTSASSNNSVKTTGSSTYVSHRRKKKEDPDIISIDELMTARPKRRNTVIILMILRVVATKKTDTFILRNFKGTTPHDVKSSYLRLFLCLDLYNKRGQTVYIGEGRGIGVNLWSHCANYRDNGTCGVGTIIVLNCPSPITKLLGGTPVIETNSNLDICDREQRSNIPLDEKIAEQTTRGFIVNNCQLQVLSVEVLTTNCKGFFCDRQRSAELLRTGKNCGCYNMRGNSSNLSIVHCIEFEDPTTQEIYKMEEFSSIKFSLLYLTQYFPITVQRECLDPLSDNHDDLYDSIDNVLNFYNKNGGFTIIGWYRRGEIVDSVQYDTKSTDKVTASDVNYHVTSIYPSGFIDEEPDEVQEMKFNVLKIE